MWSNSQTLPSKYLFKAHIGIFFKSCCLTTRMINAHHWPSPLIPLEGQKLLLFIFSTNNGFRLQWFPVPSSFSGTRQLIISPSWQEYGSNSIIWSDPRSAASCRKAWGEWKAIKDCHSLSIGSSEIVSEWTRETTFSVPQLAWSHGGYCSPEHHDPNHPWLMWEAPQRHDFKMKLADALQMVERGHKVEKSSDEDDEDNKDGARMEASLKVEGDPGLLVSIQLVEKKAYADELRLSYVTHFHICLVLWNWQPKICYGGPKMVSSGL